MKDQSFDPLLSFLSAISFIGFLLCASPATLISGSSQRYSPTRNTLFPARFYRYSATELLGGKRRYDYRNAGREQFYFFLREEGWTIRSDISCDPLLEEDWENVNGLRSLWELASRYVFLAMCGIERDWSSSKRSEALGSVLAMID